MDTEYTDESHKANELWFSPEVVILRAKTRIFRVFVSILKAKSSVFADMFMFPQPSQASSDMEMIEGIPVVEVYDDPDEMEAFLKAIFDADFFHPPGGQPDVKIDFQHIVGVLRLSHKYDVVFLRRRALRYLEASYPITLTARDTVLDPASAGSLKMHFRAIEVALEVGAVWLLPAAYYALCAGSEIKDIMSSASWDELNAAQQMACIVGYTALLKHSTLMLRTLLGGVSGDTELCDPSHCSVTLEELAFDTASVGAVCDCLNVLSREFWAAMAVDSTLCQGCQRECQTRWDEATSDFWLQLPEMFGLPSWLELQTARRSMLEE